jgi:hypothetical protein
MVTLPRPLLAVARAQRGLLATDDLRSNGIGRGTRGRLLTSGMLVAVHKGVYRLGGHPTTFEQRCHAALLFAPDAVLSGPTAGRLWGLRKVMTDDIHILATRSIHLREISPHTTDLLSDADIIERHGLRLLRPARLLCDLAWHLDLASPQHRRDAARTGPLDARQVDTKPMRTRWEEHSLVVCRRDQSCSSPVVACQEGAKRRRRDAYRCSIRHGSVTRVSDSLQQPPAPGRVPR